MAYNDENFTFKEYCKVFTYLSIEANEILIKASYCFCNINNKF